MNNITGKFIKRLFIRVIHYITGNGGCYET